MNRIFLLGLLALATSLVPERGALASFGDCATTGYLGHFDGVPGGTSITCRERLRVPVSTSEGRRHIRIIQDDGDSWSAIPGAETQMERGVRATARALRRIGSFEMDDVTILVRHAGPPRPGDEDLVGPAEAYADGERGRECYITLLLHGEAGGRPSDIAWTVAHEVFHCVQIASLEPRRERARRDWWSEGSAEWFANLAIEEEGVLPELMGDFEAAVEAGTPLYRMSYEAALFFLWLGNERRPSTILPFLRQMATSSSDGAQIAAMGDALPAEDWQHFAQDYLDGAIGGAHGERYRWPAGSMGDGTTWRFEGNRVERIELAPFVLTRGWLDFDCGTWHLESRPGHSEAAARRDEPGAAWAAVARDHDTRSEGDRLRFGALSAEPAAVTLEIDAERREACAPCARSEEVDACVVGAWRMTGGGAVEWMRQFMPPNVSLPVHERSDSAMVLRDDGTYWTQPLTQRLVIIAREPDGINKADGTAVAQGAGRWSIQGGELQICQESGGLNGNAQLSGPSFSGNLPLEMPGAGVISMTYSCSETTLQTNMDMPQGGPMRTTYSRISPPPE